MSDRIAVMMGGEVVQVGSPDEIYSDPADVRVAEFIGSPKINLLPGAVDEDGTLRVLDRPTRLAVPRPIASAIRVGVRAEALRVAVDGPIVGRIVHLENLGSEVFVHTEVAGRTAPVVSRHDPVSARGLRIGEMLRLTWTLGEERLFDDAGLRVRPLPAETGREVVHV